MGSIHKAIFVIHRLPLWNQAKGNPRYVAKLDLDTEQHPGKGTEDCLCLGAPEEVAQLLLQLMQWTPRGSLFPCPWREGTIQCSGKWCCSGKPSLSRHHRKEASHQWHWAVVVQGAGLCLAPGLDLTNMIGQTRWDHAAWSSCCTGTAAPSVPPHQPQRFLLLSWEALLSPFNSLSQHFLFIYFLAPSACATKRRLGAAQLLVPSAVLICALQTTCGDLLPAKSSGAASKHVPCWSDRQLQGGFIATLSNSDWCKEVQGNSWNEHSSQKHNQVFDFNSFHPYLDTDDCLVYLSKTQ